VLDSKPRKAHSIANESMHTRSSPILICLDGTGTEEMCFVVQTLEYCQLWQDHIRNTHTLSTLLASPPTGPEHPVQEWETKFVAHVLAQVSTRGYTKTNEQVQIHTYVVFLLVCNQLGVYRLVHMVQKHLAVVLSRMSWNTYRRAALEQ
jgi:hypothetical protein